MDKSQKVYVFIFRTEYEWCVLGFGLFFSLDIIKLIWVATNASIFREHALAFNTRKKIEEPSGPGEILSR